MSRVEEKEAARQETALQDRKLAERRANDKNTSKKFELSTQQNNRDNSRRQGQAKAQRGDASRMLDARNGIVRNAYAASELQHGDNHLLANRSLNAQQEGDTTTDKSKLQQQENERLEQRQGLRGGNAPISRDDAQKGNKGGADAGGSGDKKNDSQLAAQIAQNPAFQKLSAGSTQSASSAGGSPTTMRTIADQIVKQLRAGRDTKGVGTVHIELKDNVLAGSSILISRDDEGVSVKVSTLDRNVERLFGSGESQKELSDALKEKGINLKGIKVVYGGA